jgi:hypothetical protein
MAGITVAMLAESCEKNSVAFLYIYILKCVSSVQYVYGTRQTYLEDAYKIIDNNPVIVVEFILSQL